LPSFYLFRGGKVYGTVIGARPPQLQVSSTWLCFDISAHSSLQELIAKAAAYVDEPAGPAAAEVKAAANTPAITANAAPAPEKAAPAPAAANSSAPTTA